MSPTRRSYRSLVVALVTVVTLTLAARGASADTMPVTLIGQVEVAAGTAAPGCQVFMYTYPSYTAAATCDANGTFQGGGTIYAHWASVQLRIDVPGYPSRHVRALVTAVKDLSVAYGGVNPRMIDAGTIVVAAGARGAVTGKLTLPSTDDYDTAVVAIPELGLFVQPNAAGIYLIPGVVAGARTVYLFLPGRAPVVKAATVISGAIASNVSFTVQPGIVVNPDYTR